MISEASSFTCSLHQPGDIDKFDSGGNDALGLVHFRKDVQSLIGDADHADIGIDGTKRVILRLRLARAGYRIKEGRLPNVGQSDDSGFQHEHAALAEISLTGHSKLPSGQKIFRGGPGMGGGGVPAASFPGS